MVEVYQPLSLWIQLASLFFTLSGVHGDLLVIRFFLVLAYVMLFVNAILGSPLWPDVSSPGISVDSLVWAIIGLYVHGASLMCLILDERKVNLNDDAAALWRMFYRTGGLSRRLFKVIIAPNFDVAEFQEGEHIPTDNYFYIVYKGHVQLEAFHSDERKVQRTVRSGEMFDMTYLGMFSEKSIFTSSTIKCTSLDRTKLFRFSRDEMSRIAHQPFNKGVWQSLLINSLSCAVEGHIQSSKERRDAVPTDYVDSIFQPLEDWEMPDEFRAGSGASLKQPLRHLVRASLRSFSPPWPFAGHASGMRQTQLPPPPQRPSSTTAHSGPLFHRIRSSIFGDHHAMDWSAAFRWNTTTTTTTTTTEANRTTTRGSSADSGNDAASERDHEEVSAAVDATVTYQTFDFEPSSL